MGADFAKAALAAGHSVVASSRDTARVSNALEAQIEAKRELSTTLAFD
jgi:hypothetical protein